MDVLVDFEDSSPGLLPADFSFYGNNKGKQSSNVVTRLLRSISNRLMYMKRRSKYVLTLSSTFVMLVFLVIFLAVNTDHASGKSNSSNSNNGISKMGPKTYALQQSYLKYSNVSTTYQIAVVADRDKASKKDGKVAWESSLILGTLTRDPATGKYSVKFGSTIPLKSTLSEAGRGMELSELVYFNGMLLAFDDRTGVVFEVIVDKGLAVPRYIMMEGDGNSEKGQKTEWATVKDGLLYSGSIGKEWANSDGKILHYKPQWAKTISPEGTIRAYNWQSVFENMRRATGTSLPGYLIHEAVCFNPVSRLWYFMPRRESTEEYNDVKDEERGSNLAIVVNEGFRVVSVERYGEFNPKRGTASCKFVPFRENEFVSIRTMEYKDTVKSYITVVNLNGDVLLPETEFADAKYEGVEFI